MAVGFTTTYAISTYHHWCCKFESRSGRGVLDTTLCDKVFQWLATRRSFSPGPPVYSTNKTDCQDITEILLKVALNTIKQTSINIINGRISNKTRTKIWYESAGKKTFTLVNIFNVCNKMMVFDLGWDLSKLLVS